MQKSILLINIIPLVLLSLALFKLNPANFHPFHPKGTWTPVAAGSALMVWAYAGIESATVPAEEMQTPQRTIRLGTLLGYGLATMIFLLSAVAVVGALPNDVIASSARPLELAVRETLGGCARDPGEHGGDRRIDRSAQRLDPDGRAAFPSAPRRTDCSSPGSRACIRASARRTSR